MGWVSCLTRSSMDACISLHFVTLPRTSPVVARISAEHPSPNPLASSFVLTSSLGWPHDASMVLELLSIPLVVLPFPAIDPVLISVGPLAIRWYALAYIAGILLG